MLRKLLVAGGLSLLTLGSLSSGTNAATTINLTNWQGEEPGFKDWWNGVIAAFEEANPDVKINVQNIPFKDYVSQLTVRMASGRPPELLTLPIDGFATFAPQGWLSDLGDLIEGTPITSNWSDLQSEMVWEGKTEGVLLGSHSFMLFYNESLLQKAGLTPPTSFDDFATAVSKATDRDAGIFGIAAVTTEHPTLTVDLLRYADWQGHPLIKDGRYNLTDPGVIAAVENYRKIVGGNAALGNNSTVARQLFTEGKAAFFIDGPFFNSALEKSPPEVRPHLKMMKTPFTPVLGSVSHGIHLAEGLDADQRDKAWSFVKFLAQPEWQQKYTQLTWGASGQRNPLTPDMAAQSPVLKVINDSVIGVSPLVPRVAKIRANSGEFYAITQRAALQVISTEQPVADIMAATQEALEKAIPLDN